MIHIDIVEKTFTREELVNAQQKINTENSWATDTKWNAERQIDCLLRKVKR